MTRTSPRPLVLLLLAGAALAGCATTPKTRGEVAAETARTPLDRYPASVAEVPDEVALAPHAEGLSAHQRAVLLEFAGRWRDAGGQAPMVVETPAAGADAESMGLAARSFLVTQAGVPAAAVRLQPYAADGARPPVRVRFERLAAKVETCGARWDNLVSTNGNEPYEPFGCSLAANMAAQIADPRDLVQGRPLDPADAARRYKQLQLYREGKSTASEKEKQSDGTVSTAVQQ